MSELKKLRERLGYTQNDLARILKVTERTIYRWEMGDRPSKKHQRAIEKLARNATPLLGPLTVDTVKFLLDLALREQVRCMTDEIPMHEGEEPSAYGDRIWCDGDTSDICFISRRIGAIDGLLTFAKKMGIDLSEHPAQTWCGIIDPH